jgi:hypothetical protein
MLKLCRLTGHWWSFSKGWGVRACRLCSKKEQRMYDSHAGLYWVFLE